MPYEEYYALWRRIAREFGFGEVIQPEEAYPFVKHIRSERGEFEVPGILIAYSPYKNADGTAAGPPVLHFRPDAITQQEGHPGEPAIHYEWVLKHGRGTIPDELDAALHFHFKEPAANKALSDRIDELPPIDVPGEKLPDEPHTFKESRFYRAGWTCHRYRLRRSAGEVLADPSAVAAPVVRAMEHLIVHTWEDLLKGWGESPRNSDMPFGRYEGNGRDLLGPPKLGDSTCRHGYGIPVFRQCGTECAYCGLEIGASYESWLSASVDHVVPVSVSWSREHSDWIGDITNLVTCCRACNEFLNGYRVRDDSPANLQEFYDLRDRHFTQKRKHAMKRHADERSWYDGWLRDRQAERRAGED